MWIEGLPRLAYDFLPSAKAPSYRLVVKRETIKKRPCASAICHPTLDLVAHDKAPRIDPVDMYATNPPSAAQAANSGPSGAQYVPLRNSCEACASAKLRCPKEKPTCHRCAKRGLVCEYFAIKRAGRKPGVRSSGSEGSTKSNGDPPGLRERTQSFQGTATKSPDTLMDQLVVLNQSLPSTFIDMDTVSDLCFTSDEIEFNFLNTGDLSSTHINGGGGGSSNFSCNSISSAGTTCVGNDGLGCDRHENSSTGLPGLDITVPELLGLNLPNSAAWNSSFLELELTETSCSCLAEATSFITLLTHLSSTVCSTWALLDLDNVKLLRMVLDVIEQNKATIDAVSGILNCPNFHDGCLYVIISLVISKMMSLYAAIACKDRILQDLQQPDLARSIQQSESVLPGPALVDKYNMERSDPQCMAGRIVLGELHRLRHLIAQLVEKLRSQEVTQESGGAAKTQETMDVDSEMRLPFSAGMYEHLDLDLRKRLKALSWAVVDRMTRF